MNQRIWSSLTVTLTTIIFGTATSSYAQQIQVATPDSAVKSSTAQVQGVPATSITSVQPTDQSPEVIKVGEFQSRLAPTEDVIAKIHAHEIAGRQAATLFVRSIPVLTFLGSESVATDGTKMGQADSLQKTASEDTAPQLGTANTTGQISAAPNVSATDNNDPVWRATAIAAKLNQLSRDNVNADAIAVQRQPDCNCYSIDINEEELVRINETTILPDTTNNLAEDALQATNRLRRLMGNAPPLREIAGMPVAAPLAQVSLGPIQVQISGVASWYGPGFHGKRSASGERYNQNAMTAAHRSLPFGTNVQVTNLNNGRSVVVRINDRGPYIRGRVIDLSAAAARMLGLIQTGTAPVRLDVLDPSQPALVEN